MLSVHVSRGFMSCPSKALQAKGLDASRGCSNSKASEADDNLQTVCELPCSHQCCRTETVRPWCHSGPHCHEDSAKLRVSSGHSLHSPHE